MIFLFYFKKKDLLINYNFDVKFFNQKFLINSLISVKLEFFFFIKIIFNYK